MSASWLDEAGRLYLQTAQGLGLVHSQDMLAAAEAIEAGRWQPEAVQSDELPQRFGFVKSPLANKGQQDGLLRHPNP